MDFTEGQRQLLLYWGNIQQSVSARASTADLWANVKAAAAAEGNSLGGVRMTDMNGLRSIAASQRSAMDNLQAARVDSVITGNMLGRDLSSRGLTDQSLAPRFLVRFEHDVTVGGQLQTFWRSSFFDGSLPTTKGDLMSAVNQDAQALADDYDVTHAGVGRIQISAV
jgi:hypothetical protein